MSTHPPFRKVHESIATRKQMFALFNHHDDAPFDQDRLDGSIYAGEWFEITEEDYTNMLGVLPPLFMRVGMFGMSEFKAGFVTSVFLAIRIHTRQRWFHGFCNLSDKRSPEAMRAAIIAYETGSIDSMTREEKLEAIWNRTPADQGIAGEADPGIWPPEQRGRRTILVYSPKFGTTLKLLDDLTDKEIEDKLSAGFKSGARAAGS